MIFEATLPLHAMRGPPNLSKYIEEVGRRAMLVEGSRVLAGADSGISVAKGRRKWALAKALRK